MRRRRTRSDAPLPCCRRPARLVSAPRLARRCARLDHDGNVHHRAALTIYCERRRLLHLVCPLLTGAKALGGDPPRRSRPGPPVFLVALAEEVDAGTEIMRLMQRKWFAAPSAVQDQRRDSLALLRSTLWLRRSSSLPPRSPAAWQWRLYSRSSSSAGLRSR
jgi:hypothetical protein